jgi:Fur family ferric uptake transcriptional regulator
VDFVPAWFDGAVAMPDEAIVLGLIRARGGRITAARRAVVEALVAAGDDHITAAEVAERVESSHPEVHRSTIYRTLDALEELGVLTHVHLGHGPSTFHLAEDAHLHAVCSACGQVIELPRDALDDVARQLARRGFVLAPQHFALSGRCRSCR